MQLTGGATCPSAVPLEQGARYKPAADALIDVLVELQRAAQWTPHELRRIGRVGTEIVGALCARGPSSARVSLDRLVVRAD